MRRLLTALIVLAVIAPTSVEAAAGDPVGSLDSVSVRGQGQWAMFGWAADPDAPSGQLAVHLYVNGRRAGETVTYQPRPDVEQAFPYAGPSAGFEGFVRATTGDRVCAYAINRDRGSNNTTLGCLTVPSGANAADPRGHVDVVDVWPGMVRLLGWVGDPDAPKNDQPQTRMYPGEYVPTLIELHIDRTVLVSQQTFGTLDRPDVHHAFPDMPNAKGFDLRIPVLPGAHGVCAYALNSGRAGNNNTTLGCWTVAVSGVRFEPGGVIGHLDEMRFGAGPQPEQGTYLNARGWAWDPDGTNPVTVRVRGLDIAPMTSFDEGSTGEPRPDVQRAYPSAPPNSGYTVGTRVWLSGARTRQFRYLCAYAVDGDREVLLGCRNEGEFKNVGDA